eukprot:gene41485-28468_t
MAAPGAGVADGEAPATPDRGRGTGKVRRDEDPAAPAGGVVMHVTLRSGGSRMVPVPPDADCAELLQRTKADPDVSHVAFSITT